ncbi:uncharacterized protein LOC121986018 [Zingiber officinale]|uniref:uncharacterized protein LOC121986018 n=1 Tax=Zingiber officinale TaxID=94328 RepID=UPI001C4B0055|nr:uncharacterized protein LOC121986018 [Zingiber officinale]
MRNDMLSECKARNAQRMSQHCLRGEKKTINKKQSQTASTKSHGLKQQALNLIAASLLLHCRRSHRCLPPPPLSPLPCLLLSPPPATRRGSASPHGRGNRCLSLLLHCRFSFLLHLRRDAARLRPTPAGIAASPFSSTTAPPRPNATLTWSMWRGSRSEGRTKEQISMEASSSSATSLTRRCMNDEQGETPNISCYCGLRATLWTSWKETNPGRRFFSCPRFRDRGCGFFLWHDPELSERTKAIINHLKMDNKKLQMEISELKKNNSFKGAIDCNDLLEDVNNSVTIKLSDEICSLNRKFRVAIVVVVFTWIVMILRWLM